MRRNHPNFRRDIKNLIKNIQRKDLQPEEVRGWFLERGIWLESYHFNNRFPGITLSFLSGILTYGIPGRIVRRVGNAARKKGKFVKWFDLIAPKWWGKRHEIPFVEPVEVLITEIRETSRCKFCLLDDKGNLEEISS